MKQGHIGDAFFDLDAASFLLTELDDTAGLAANSHGKQEPLSAMHAECSPSHSHSSVSNSPAANGSSPEQVWGKL